MATSTGAGMMVCLSLACPCCGGEITLTVAALLPAESERAAHSDRGRNLPASGPNVREIDMLEPCLIAYRLGVSESYARKLIKRGIAQNLPGFEKRGGRLFAAPDAVEAIWRR